MNFPLNGTFIVQAVNFFIVYRILERLFFKPFLAQIRQEEHHHTVLVQRSVTVHAEREELQNTINMQWQQCKSTIDTMRPSVFIYSRPPLSTISFKEVVIPHDTQKITAHLRSRLEKIC